jgi:hypothetical protein
MRQRQEIQEVLWKELMPDQVDRQGSPGSVEPVRYDQTRITGAGGRLDKTDWATG